MTKEKVKKIADNLLDNSRFQDWGYEVGEPNKKNSDCWQVIFRWLPSNDEIFDGYGVIFVDENTGEATFL